MKILTGGCSFTAHPVEETLAWPFFLEDKGLEVLNTAEMASGNEIILDRICTSIKKASFDYVIVMWSSPYRYQFFFNKETPNYKSLHKILSGLRGKSKFDGYSNYILEGKSEPHPDSNWLRVGGGYGHWKYDIEYLDKLNTNYLSNFFNYEYQFIQTCKSIVTLQALCKSLGVKLINTSWQNIWDDLYARNGSSVGSNWINPATVEKLVKGKVVYKPVIDMYPNARPWYDLIDWETWVFYENDKVKRGGLGEFAVFENNDYLESGSHPLFSSQKLWAEFIYKYINPPRYI